MQKAGNYLRVNWKLLTENCLIYNCSLFQQQLNGVSRYIEFDEGENLPKDMQFGIYNINFASKKVRNRPNQEILVPN